jgi:hypothetical protein
MGRPKKEQPVEQVKEVEEQPVEQVKEVDKAKVLLQEIDKLEQDVIKKRKEYSEYIASQRKEVRTPTLAECHKLSMRDDLKSDRRELKKVTALAISKLKRNK